MPTTTRRITVKPDREMFVILGEIDYSPSQALAVVDTEVQAAELVALLEDFNRRYNETVHHKEEHDALKAACPVEPPTGVLAWGYDSYSYESVQRHVVEISDPL